MSNEKEPLVGLGKSGEDPVIEKLDILIEGQETQQDLLEEIIEKLAEFEMPYPNSGFGSFNN